MRLFPKIADMMLFFACSNKKYRLNVPTYGKKFVKKGENCFWTKFNMTKF